MSRAYASKYNGTIKVKSFIWQKSVWAGGVEQSGPLVKAVWQKALNVIASKAKQSPKDALILGLGCGSAASILAKKFPGIKITGVEIDPVMIKVGKEYFSLEEIPHLKIVIADARKFRPGCKYNLILVDTYIGEKAVEIKNLKKMVLAGGKIIINHLEPGRSYSNTTYVIE